MAKLPESLAIALWMTGSIWLLGLVALLFDFDHEVIWAALVFGVATGVWEWLARGRKRS